MLGWTKKPDYQLSRSTSEFDVDFAINELGLRDDPMADPAKPAGTFRVLMLGDSFTLGFTVDRQDLFVDQLERWWQAEGRAVDVINAGTEGYSTDQAILWLAEHGATFQPDLVLLFPYDNDLYWNGQTDYMGRQKPRYAPDGKLETGPLGERGRHLVALALRPDAPAGAPAGAGRALLRTGHQDDREGARRAAAREARVPRARGGAHAGRLRGPRAHGRRARRARPGGADPLARGHRRGLRPGHGRGPGPGARGLGSVDCRSTR